MAISVHLKISLSMWFPCGLSTNLLGDHSQQFVWRLYGRVDKPAVKIVLGVSMIKMNINSVKDINANEKLHDYSGQSPFSDLIKFGIFAFANCESGGVWKNSSNLIGRVEERRGALCISL